MKRYIQATHSNPKTYNGYVVQEHTSMGWEDIVTYDDTSSESLKDAKATVKDYIDNGYQARVITRKFDNPNYVEPTMEFTSDDAINYIENECPYKVEELMTNYPNENYAIAPDGGYTKCQVLIHPEDNYVAVYNVSTNRTKQVYSLDAMISLIDKIVNA